MYKTTTTPFGKSCTNSLISHRFVVAYKKPIVEAFFYPSVYIYARGSPRKFNVGVYIYALVAVRGGEFVFYRVFGQANSTWTDHI